MSKEAAKAFIEKMKSDQEFERRVMAVKDKTARLGLAKREGFDFSFDDLMAVQPKSSGGDVQGQALLSFCCYGMDGCNS